MLQLAFVNFKQNSYLVVEGKSESDRFYIIQSGRVSCHHENEVPGSTPDCLGPGDFVGVIPCMSGHSQIETVMALTDVVAISVKREQYPELIAKNIPVALKIIRTFANKMRTLNDNLTKLTLKNTLVDSPEQLYGIAAYYEKMGMRDIATYGYYQYIKACPNGANIEAAKRKFITLKPLSHAVYLESNNDLIRNYPKNTMIFSECQSGHDMFLIQEGSVKISKVVDGNEVTLALLKKGDMFGEMALLENKPRSASAIAHEDCRLLTVNSANFNQMVTTQPQLIARLTTMLADRLWSMYRQLSNTQLFDPKAKLIDMLALQVEKAKITIAPKISYQTELTLQDLANMCGIPQDQQLRVLFNIQSDSHIRLVNNQILVPDVLELIKQAAFYRKQNTLHR